MGSPAELFFSRARRMAVVTTAILCVAFAAGCYIYVPSDPSRLIPGQQVAYDLNDLGRLNLSSQIGEEVARISGIVVQQSPASSTLKVTELTYLNGRSTQWSGEAITIRQDFIKASYEQQLSKSKTAAAALAGAAGVGALVAARAIVGSSVGDNGGKTGGNPPSTPTTIRIHQ
jgi:hypothetical protein